MRAIQVKCAQCAAVLKVGPQADFIDCEYCGARSAIQRRSRVLQIPRPVKAAAQGEAHTPRVAVQLVNRARVVVSLFSTLLSFALIAGIFWFVNRQVEKATGQSVIGLAAGKLAAPARMSWLGHGPVLLARVDGDAILDPVGRVRYVAEGDACHLAAFSGATGQRIWQSAPLGSYSDTYQGRVLQVDALVLFADPRGALTAYQVRDGARLWSVALRDQVARACRLGEGEIAIQTADDAWHAVSLASGAIRTRGPVASCRRLADDDEASGDPGLAIRPSGSLRLRGMAVDRVASRAAASGGAGPRVAVGYRQPGSPVPMLARLDEHRRPRALWQAEVPADNPLAAGGSAPALVSVTDSQACAVYEVQAGPRLTCFDLASGARQFDAAIEKGVTIVMRSLVWSGGRFYLSSWGHLQVLDGATGRRLHLIGAL